MNLTRRAGCRDNGLLKRRPGKAVYGIDKIDARESRRWNAALGDGNGKCNGDEDGE